MRTSGVSPSAAARSDVVMSTAAAPSEICDELPALISPLSTNRVGRLASFSSVAPRRTPSSPRTSPTAVATGTISSSNKPRPCAAAARSCDNSAYRN